MEELRARLNEIKDDMQELERLTEMIQQETSIFDCFYKVKKEVI